MAALQKIVPNIPPDSVEMSALPGLYQVSYGPSVVYVSADGRYLIQGDMVELESGRTPSTRGRGCAVARGEGRSRPGATSTPG